MNAAETGFFGTPAPVPDSCAKLMIYTTFFDQVPVWSLQDRYHTTIEVKMPLSFIVQADENFLKWYLIQGKSIPGMGYKRK